MDEEMKEEFQKFLKDYFDGFFPPCWVVEKENQEVVLKKGIVLVGFLVRGEEVLEQEALVVNSKGVFICPFVQVTVCGDKKAWVQNFVERQQMNFKKNYSQEMKNFLWEFRRRYEGKEDDLKVFGSPFSPSLLWAMSRGLIIPPLISSVVELVKTLE